MVVNEAGIVEVARYPFCGFFLVISSQIFL
jgi:hypothetical protein